MNILKRIFQYWTPLKYILAWGGAWIVLQIPFPAEYKDINFYSVNLPILGLMFLVTGWICIIIMIDSKVEKRKESEK